MRYFYGRTKIHSGQDAPSEHISFGVHVDDEAELRRAFDIPNDERVIVAGEKTERDGRRGIRIFPSTDTKRHVLMGPQKDSGHKFIGQFGPKRFRGFRSLPVGGQTWTEGELGDGELFIQIPEKMNPLKQKGKTINRKPAVRTELPKEPDLHIQVVDPITTVLMGFPGKELTFNVPLGIAMDVAFDWEQYKE